MKFNDISFPHPVLGVGDAINSDIELGIPEIKSSGDIYDISLKPRQDNYDLRQLLETGKAEFLCEATCSNTLYRISITSKTNKIEFSIPKKAVKGRVEFLCLLVTKENI